MARWRTRGAVGLTAALSLGLLISTTSGFSQADDRLPDVLTCQQFLAADPAAVPTTYTVLVPATTSCELTGVALAGDLVVQPGAELSLTTSSVAGTVSAESASRLALTDVAVVGAVRSVTAGTVPGPVVDPVPVVDPAAPVPPVVALTRVDAESTIEITGTLGGVVVAGTDLLGTLTVADTTGDLVVASAEQPVPFAAAAAGDADLAVDGTDALAPGTAAAQDDDAAAAAEVLPPVRTLIGTDLELTRISGAIVVDGTTVTGQVRLQQNGTTPLFGTQALVAGGVHEVRPDPAPTTPDPVPSSPQPAVPAPTTDPVVPVETTDPVDGGNAAPGTTDTEPTTEPSEPTDTREPTDGTETTDGTEAEETAGGTTDPGTDDGTDTAPSTDPATDDTDSSSTTAGRPGSSSGAPTTSDATSTDPADENVESPVPSSGGPALPDGLTVDFGSTSLVDLGSLRPVNGLLTADGRLSPVSLTDSRTGAPGWSVSAQLTDFAGGSRSIGAANLGWTPRLIDAESGAELGPDVAPGGSTGEGLSVIRRLGSAAPGQGGGTTVLGADLRLQLLEPVDPGTYTATLVITVLS